MKNCISFLLVFFILIIFVEDAQAQRKKRRKSREKEELKEPKPSFSQNMIYEIGFGNPSFIGGNGSSQFNIALKPAVGYKLHSRIGTGVFVKWDYLFANIFGDEFSLHDFGTGVFAKFKIVDAFYLRGEYAYQSYAYNRQSNIIDRTNLYEPLVGAGYKSGIGTWVFGGELLFHLNKEVRDTAGQVYEFWLKIDYNF